MADSCWSCEIISSMTKVACVDQKICKRRSCFCRIRTK
jgi:hypothetical protein